MNRLKDRVAIVTGGGAGIGRAISELFAEEGAAVVVAEQNPTTGKEVVEGIKKNSGKAHFVETNVADEESVQKMAAEAVRVFGRINVLGSNAAIFILKSIEATPEDWRKILDVNVMGPALCAKHAVPEIKKAGGGAIVNIASMSSFIAQPNFVTYNTSKTAILGMTRCMALDLVNHNIRVNAVAPGTVWTPQVQKLIKERGLDRAAADVDPFFGGGHMIQRIAEPREIANAVLFLASDEASFVTGQTMMVDGGYTAK